MIYVKPNRGFLEIRFRQFLEPDEFQSYVGRIKKINGRVYKNVNKDSFWQIPMSEKSYLQSMFDRKQIEWEEEPIDGPMVQKNISDDLTHIDELILPPYPFQVLGINYLCGHKKALLGDEMGLGKSLQVIGATYKLFRQGKVKKALIVCPSSLKYQWADEM